MWDWEKGKLKAMIDLNGLSNVNGLYVIEDSEPLILCYGNPEDKHSSIKTFLIKNENEGCSFVQKFDIVKDFLNNFNKNLLTHCIHPEGFVIYGTAGNEVVFQNKQFEMKSKIILEDNQIQRIMHIFHFG